METTTEQIAQALYTINKHAKTAHQPQYLYLLKRKTIEMLLEEGRAEKLGLHYSPNPGLAKQRRDTLVQIGNYQLHIPATKSDLDNLPHLGDRDPDFRNPKVYMALSVAKQICRNYLKENGVVVVKDKPRVVSMAPAPTIYHHNQVQRRRVDNEKRLVSSWLEE